MVKYYPDGSGRDMYVLGLRQVTKQQPDDTANGGSVNPLTRDMERIQRGGTAAGYAESNGVLRATLGGTIPGNVVRDDPGNYIPQISALALETLIKARIEERSAQSPTGSLGRTKGLASSKNIATFNQAQQKLGTVSLPLITNSYFPQEAVCIRTGPCVHRPFRLGNEPTTAGVCAPTTGTGAPQSFSHYIYESSAHHSQRTGLTFQPHNAEPNPMYIPQIRARYQNMSE